MTGLRLSSPRRPDGLVGGSDILLITAGAIAATCSYSTTSAPYNMAAIIVGALAVLVVLPRFELGVPRSWSLAVAAGITLVPQTLRPPSPNVHQTAWYPWSVALGIAATFLLVLALLIGSLDGSSRFAAVLLGAATVTMLVAVVITVPGGQRPEIDVWDIFQQSAAVLFHGVNPYEITHFSVPKGQTASCFNYLPVSFLASWFGWVTLDDVRYSEAAVMLAGWGAVALSIISGTGRGMGLSRRVHAVRTPLLVLGTGVLLAGTLRVAQQAWNESLILGFLLMGAALLYCRRPAWAMWAWVPVALALATKQHVALLIPLLAFWPGFGPRRTGYAMAGAVVISSPWLIWNPGRFKTCTVDFFLDITERHDSISLWRYLPHWSQSAVVIIALLTGYWLAYRFAPRTVGGLLIASAVTLFGFDLFNKQTFENQWWLYAQLIVCGLALHSAELLAASPDDAGSDGVTAYAAART